MDFPACYVRELESYETWWFGRDKYGKQSTIRTGLDESVRNLSPDVTSGKHREIITFGFNSGENNMQFGMTWKLGFHSWHMKCVVLAGEYQRAFLRERISPNSRQLSHETTHVSSHCIGWLKGIPRKGCKNWIISNNQQRWQFFEKSLTNLNSPYANQPTGFCFVFLVWLNWVWKGCPTRTIE